MRSEPDNQRVWAFAALALVCGLYFTNLTAMGMVSVDEPRYADIGRAMARTGDWITPHLWGAPWFEKPALLYWMTALGFKAGLGEDLAPRLPTTILSVAFLLFYFWRLHGEWNGRAALFSTAILATSAGWLAYSHVAVTDLPLSVFFSVAVLLSLPWIERGDRRLLPLAAAALGAAALAKGLVPLVLFLPIPLLRWRQLSDWFRPWTPLAFAAVALPWYVLCTLRNGGEFLRVFFVEHQFGRFSSTALQHGQHWYFYFPVLLLFLYPWFPLALTFKRNLPLGDARVRALLAVTAFGFVFFSAAVNKLPGYLLPLMPAACAVLGISISRAQRSVIAIGLSGALLGALPLAAVIVPAALSHGLRSVYVSYAGAVGTVAIAGTVSAAAAYFLRRQAFPFIALTAAGAFIWFQFAVFPLIDRAAPARSLAAQNAQCAPKGDRSLLYGLSYYSGRLFSECATVDQGNGHGVR